MYKLELFLTDNNEMFELLYKKTNYTNLNIFKKCSTNYTFTSLNEDDAILQISELITEFIISYYEINIIKKLIHLDYSYLQNSEKEFISQKTYEIINCGKNDLVKTLITLKRRFLIKQCILNFLSENSYLDFAGLINFRLIEYKKLLSEVIEKIISEVKAQNEYKEFIAMLKFFVDTQKNRISKLHIIFEKDGTYTILNEYNHDITTECFKDFLDDAKSHSLSNEDLLISSLITLAPKKIIVHLENPNYNQKILNTIEHIFNDKVVLNESIPYLELVTQK